MLFANVAKHNVEICINLMPDEKNWISNNQEEAQRLKLDLCFYCIRKRKRYYFHILFLIPCQELLNLNMKKVWHGKYTLYQDAKLFFRFLEKN